MNNFSNIDISTALQKVPHLKTLKCSNTLKKFISNLLTICLSVFDYLVGLTLKRLNLDVTLMHCKNITETELAQSLKHLLLLLPNNNSNNNR